MEDNLLQYISEACSSKGRQLGPETFWHKGKASPLVLAAQHGHVEVVEYLLDTVPLHPGGFVDQTALSVLTKMLRRYTTALPSVQQVWVAICVL